MHEDLLGYLLGALEPHEMEQVEAALRHSAALRAELELLKRSLEPLDTDQPPRFQPPSDLIGRTLAFIDNAEQERSEESLPGLASAKKSANKLPPAERSSFSTISPNSRGNRFRWGDVVASAIAATALIGVALPSILQSRYEARKVACQDNLRQAGMAVTTYAMRDPEQRLPPLASEGPEAFAGIYSVRLREAGLLDSLQSLWCPSLDPPAWLQRDIPAVAELHSVRADDLSVLQRETGGSYGYTLGVMDGQQYHSPRYQARATFAILGDMPARALPLATDATSKVPGGHDSRGVNLLYEDGHVRFLPIEQVAQTGDDPFLNHHGELEAGVTTDDSILAPSWHPPFNDVRQR